MGKGRVGVLGLLLVFTGLTSIAFSAVAWIQPAPPLRLAAGNDHGPNAWALLIGIDRYPSPTEDTVGSVADAKTLEAALIARGWGGDRVVTLLDGRATRENVIASLRWLASKTNENSLVVLHYSGHERDGSLLLADNRTLAGGLLTELTEPIRAQSMWIDLIACNAGGILDERALKPGRLVTTSSKDDQMSFGDVTLGHSIFGHFALEQALMGGAGDADENGTISVQEAFAYAKGRVESYTSNRQVPQMVDRTGGELYLVN